MNLITRNVVYRSYKISQSSINLPKVVKFGRIQVRLPWGGGIFCDWDFDSIITNCTISENKSTFSHSDIQGGIQSIFNTNGATATDGGGNINADPIFVDSTNDNFRLQQGSPCIDAGNNDAVPADTADLDDDGDTNEPIPFDLDGNLRFVDDPDTIDTGNGTPTIVDMGAYEYQIP